MGAGTALLVSVAYPSSVTAASFTIYANAPPWCSTAGGNSCSTAFTQAASVAAVRSSAGDEWHFDSASGLLTLRIVQPPTDYTGDPNWSLTGGRAAPFSRDGITIERCAPAPTSNHANTTRRLAQGSERCRARQTRGKLRRALRWSAMPPPPTLVFVRTARARQSLSRARGSICRDMSRRRTTYAAPPQTLRSASGPMAPR